MRQTKAQILEGINQSILSSKFVANNTVEIQYQNGDRAIRLHNTDIITFKANGDIILNSGGWRTVTTKDRLNGFSPSFMQIGQKNFIWTVYVANSDVVEKYPFHDGITLDSRGRLRSEEREVNQAEIKKLKKQIKEYVDLIDVKLPIPDNGNCWFCLFKDQDGKTMGDHFNEKREQDHLITHMKEKYLHGSILVNSMREAGYQDRQIGFHYQMNMKDTFKRTLRRYLSKRLLKG